MAMTQAEALAAWRRGMAAGVAPGGARPGASSTSAGITAGTAVPHSLGGAGEEVPEGPGVLMTGLDWLSRPVSGVMGGFYGVVSPELTPAEGLSQGLKGERYFSAYDFALEMGADPESKLTRLGSLAVDILNPADPLNYVGGGFTKLGRLAKGLPEGAASVGKVLNRVDAAEKGLWSPVTFFGQAVVPKGVSVPVARGVDALGNRISKSDFVQSMGKYFGGVRKYEAQFPGITSFMQGRAREGVVDEQSFAEEMVGIRKGLLAKGLSEADADAAIVHLASLTEKPEVRLASVERELQLTEDALAGKFTDWLPPEQSGVRSLESGEIEAITSVNMANQAAVDARVAELEVMMKGAGAGAPAGITAGTAMPHSLADSSKALDELHVLKSVQAARFAENLAPLDVLEGRRGMLLAEQAHIKELWNEAGPAVLDANAVLQPLLKETNDIYLERLRALDPDVRPPVEHYLKHMYPKAFASLPKNIVKAKAAALAKKEAMVRELAEQGLDPVAIEQEVRRRMGAEHGVLDVAVDRTGRLKGDLDAFKNRQYNMTIEEFNAQAMEKGLPQWENYTTTIAQHMRRDANEWAFGYDVHKFVKDKPGWTVKGEDYARLDKAAQGDWVKVDFHVPWVAPEKNPFKDLYVKREVNALMQSQLRGMGKLLTDDGLNGLLQTVNGFNNWWKAWTLAPFPSTRVRDLVSDMVLAHQAGLNPAVDMAKMVMGESAYGASLALNVGRSKVPALKGLFSESPRSLETILGKVNSRFAGGESGVRSLESGGAAGAPAVAGGTPALPAGILTREKLIEYMEIEGILGQSAVRDLDIGAILSNDPLLRAEGKGRSFASKAGDWVPLKRDVKNSALVKAGFKVAEATSDFTKGALFLDTLVKVLPEAKSLDDALTFATAKVRRHLFEYGDLTQIEREVMKNLIPFYTWSAKNIPLQISEAVSDPGKFAWINRLYQGAWDQFEEDEVAPEDLPVWLDKQMGLPLDKTVGPDGEAIYSVWTPRGWLPQTELNEMADLVRGEAGSQILSRLNPLLKEPFEQFLNRDAFTMREIEDGTIRDLFGVPVNRRVAHLLNNLRLVSEADRLDPGGAWTKIGQAMGWWEGERPHRWTAPGPDRTTRFLTGLNIKGVAPAEEQERRVKDSERLMNSDLSRARYALRKGQTYEAKGFLDSMKAHGEKQREAMARWNELRRRNALDVVKRESGN